jgi:hypothetical protein
MLGGVCATPAELVDDRHRRGALPLAFRAPSCGQRLRPEAPGSGLSDAGNLNLLPGACGPQATAAELACRRLDHVRRSWPLVTSGDARASRRKHGTKGACRRWPNRPLRCSAGVVLLLCVQTRLPKPPSVPGQSTLLLPRNRKEGRRGWGSGGGGNWGRWCPRPQASLPRMCVTPGGVGVPP